MKNCTPSRLFYSLLFLHLLQTSLSALPMRAEVVSGKKEIHSSIIPENNDENTVRDIPSAFEARSVVGVGAGPREMKEEGGQPSGDFGGVPVQSLENVPGESAAERLRKTLERVGRDYPTIAAEIADRY